MSPNIPSMSATKTRTKNWTKEQKAEYAQAKRTEQREMLEAAVEQLCSSEGWLTYLRTRSKFHKYSFQNTILIALQRKDATQVGSARMWREDFNRTIVKGEKAIKIFAPVPVYLKDDAGKPVTKEVDGKEVKVIDYVWFKTVPVFDVAQTEGDPVPVAPELQPIEGDSHAEYLLRAEQWADGQNYIIRFEEKGKRAKRGSANMSGDVATITINSSFPVNSQVRTTIHELAHVYGGVDYSEYSRQQAEVIVESAAFMICQNVGLDTSGMSIPYIASWGQDEDAKAALKTLREFAGKIDELVEAITEAIS